MTDEQFSSRRLYEQLAERIRHLILNGALNPGDKLPAEHILAQDYGVSRTVVREAVKTLQQDGLVGGKAGLGTFVVDATDQAFVQSLHLLMSLNLNDNMANVVEIREILEVGMATLAATRAKSHGPGGWIAGARAGTP
jgi:GntR family transcriptional repressor for pyruvate dehydrogenase complex